MSNIFTKAMGNPYMKYGAAPATIGAVGGAGTAAYLNYADKENYNLATSAALGAGIGVVAMAPVATFNYWKNYPRTTVKK